MQKDSSQQDFILKCRSHRLKITPQRVAIFDELVASTRHPTADMVHKRVTRKYPHISFDTVNRTLLTFVKMGIVDVVEVFGGAKRFDPDVSKHHHLHCVLCGKIFDFRHHDYDDMPIPEEIRNKFQIVGKRVVLQCICDVCSKVES